MANVLKVELIADNQRAGENVDQLERKIVGTENRLTQMGKRGNDAGRELASGLGIPLGPAAALLAGIGLLTVGVNKAMQAARVGSDANRVLSSSATEAGIAYDIATGKAQKFADITGLGGTQAKQTFSSIIQVAKVAGETDDLDNIQKRFADLAAARGVAAPDLSTLAQQILSGQDEALNRLGLADPSKLAEDWAKAHGRTVESMSQSEQVASRLDAVMRKGAMFDGSAETRLASVSGQLTLTEQSMANMTTATGEAIFANMEFRDLLSTVNGILKEMSFSSDDVAAKLNAGLTPAQIAAEQAGGAWNTTLDGIKNALNIIPALAVGMWDSLTGSKTPQEILDQLLVMSFGAGDRRQQILEDQINAEKKVIDAQKLAAVAQKVINEAKKIADANAASGKETVAELEKQLKKQKEVEKEIQATFQDTRIFLDDMLERVNKDNPFVTLFSEASNVMREMQKQFGTFGDEFVNQMAKVKMQAIDMEVLAARIQSSQKVLDVQAEIRKLQFGPTGTSAEDQRRLGVFDKRIDAARDIPRLEAQARAVEQAGFGRGPAAIDQGAILNRQIEEILKLKTQFVGDSVYGSRESQSKINEQLISLFEGASPQMQAALIQRGGRGFRQEISGAYQGQADDRRQAIQDELRRAEAGRFVLEAAQKSLVDLKRFGGLDNDEVRKVFLAKSGGLSDTELTPQLRMGREAALTVEAKKEAEKEKKAEEDRKLLNTALDVIMKQITGKGFKVDQAGAGVLVEIRDKSNRASVTGPAFDADQGRRDMQGL